MCNRENNQENAKTNKHSGNYQTTDGKIIELKILTQTRLK